MEFETVQLSKSFSFSRSTEGISVDRVDPMGRQLYNRTLRLANVYQACGILRQKRWQFGCAGSLYASAPNASWRLTLRPDSSREDSIPSRRILAIKVVLAIPKRAAAPCRPPTTHLVSSRV
jgi:hypothetical protein